MGRPIRTVGLWNYHVELNRDNFMLTHSNASIGDDLLVPFVELRKRLGERHVEVATLDVLNPADIDAFLFIEMPDMSHPYVKAAFASGKPLYLLVLESPLVRPENHDTSRHTQFTKVFTYNDLLVDNRKYFKINYSFSFPQAVSFDHTGKEKLCVTIAGNKKQKVRGVYQELYSERLAAIRWFEENHPEDFDLYGFGWGRPALKLSRVINPVKLLKILRAPRYATYRGIVERKRSILGRYRFCLSYENVRDVPGYITEKIFDCFFAGTVPVYLGASNISDYIPGDCFIDKRDFPDYEQLYRYMATMPETEYREYVENIRAFLLSEKIMPFACETFVGVITRHILRDS